MSTYRAFENAVDGHRALAKARLRYRVLGALERALEGSGLTKTGLSDRLGIRKSAVSQVFGGDGNLRVNTIADYLDAMGCELEVNLVPAGTARSKVGRHETSKKWDFFEQIYATPAGASSHVAAVPRPVESVGYCPTPLGGPRLLGSAPTDDVEALDLVELKVAYTFGAVMDLTDQWKLLVDEAIEAEGEMPEVAPA